MSSGGMSLDDLQPLAPRLAERGWHVQLWIETGDLQALAPDLEKLPFDFVIDHMGRTMADKGVDYPGFRDFCEKAEDGTLLVQALGRRSQYAPGLGQGGRRSTIRPRSCRRLVAANPDRLVWGGDWPQCRPCTG